MKQKFIQYVSFIAAVLLTVTAVWADTSPIGTLKAQGKVAIQAPSSTLTLVDQEYAYFSDDGVRTDQGAQAEVGLNEGLKVTFVGAAEGSIARNDGVYSIDIRQGHIVVDAEPAVDYRIFHDGKAVSPDQALNASDEPFVVSVAEAGDVQFYMPAQLDDDDRAAGGLRGSLARTGISAGQIAAIIAAVAGTVYIVTHDDDEPSS